MSPAASLGAASFIGAALLVSSLGAGPATADGSGALPSGAHYVVERNGSQAAAVALWFRAPVAGFDPAAPQAGIGRLAAAAIAASKPITGTPLAQAVERLGGRLAVAAYPGSVAVTALVPADRAAAIVRAMTAVYFTPVLDGAGLQIARRDVGEETLLRRFDDVGSLDDALAAAMFSAGATRYATYPAAAVLQLPAGPLRTYAERAFRPSNATLVVVGAVAADVAASAVGGRDGAPAGSEPPIVATPATGAADGAPERRRGIGLGWVGPPIGDETDATALDFLADALFRDDSGSVVRATSGTGTSVEGKFVTYHDPGVFLVTISGTGDYAKARAEVQRAVAAAATPLGATAFAQARSAFVYHLIADTSAPAEIADTLGWYTVEGAPAYAPSLPDGAYWRRVAALTPATVAAAAKKYLGTAPHVIDAQPTPAPSASPAGGNRS